VRFALAMAGLTWLTAACAFSVAEDVGVDGRVEGFWDALWWSAATITTVDYGDIAPITVAGRAVAMVTMIVGISLNVTAVGATAATFLTIWPDGTRPLASSLNPAPGQPPTPNAVATQLSGAGAFNVFNRFGTVDVIVDVNGYGRNARTRDRRELLPCAFGGDAISGSRRVDSQVALCRYHPAEARHCEDCAGAAHGRAGARARIRCNPTTTARWFSPRQASGCVRARRAGSLSIGSTSCAARSRSIVNW
jgi:hypothetical protein